MEYEVAADDREQIMPRWPKVGESDAIWTDSAGTPHRIMLSAPAWINELDPRITSATAALVEDATIAISQYDFGYGQQRPWLRPLLIRAEAAASSRIEGIAAFSDAILRAELGGTESREATLIAANVGAIEMALSQASDMNANSVREVHRVLMTSESRHTPGEFRKELVWIGGDSPIGAVYLPPNDRWAAVGVEDVMAFDRRSNLARLVQAAVAHAQFESIHPFSDGNGRVGRALISASLFRQNLTAHLGVAPISAGLMGNPVGYIAALTAYRGGDIEPIIQVVANAVFRALREADRLRSAVDDVIEDWKSRVSGRSDSGIFEVLKLVSGRPTVTASLVAEHLAIDATNSHAHIRRLVELGVLESRPTLGRRSVWVAPEILGAMDDFLASISRRGNGY
jgi:Fic family protein